jgi:hypothetical protein
MCRPVNRTCDGPLKDNHTEYDVSGAFAARSGKWVANAKKDEQINCSMKRSQTAFLRVIPQHHVLPRSQPEMKPR